MYCLISTVRSSPLSSVCVCLSRSRLRPPAPLSCTDQNCTRMPVSLRTMKYEALSADGLAAADWCSAPLAACRSTAAGESMEPLRDTAGEEYAEPRGGVAGLPSSSSDVLTASSDCAASSAVMVGRKCVLNESTPRTSV